MAKFIIGVDAFSNPESHEDEFITHTEHPKFIAEIIFAESHDLAGFKFDSLNMIWSEPCEKTELAAAVKEAKAAVEYYTQQSLLMEE